MGRGGGGGDERASGRTEGEGGQETQEGQQQEVLIPRPNGSLMQSPLWIHPHPSGGRHLWKPRHHPLQRKMSSQHCPRAPRPSAPI